MGQSPRVRLKDGLSDSAVIGRGTDKVARYPSYSLTYILKPCMLRDTLSGVNEGIRVGGHLILFCIKTVRFADDQATLAGSFKGLQLMMDKMQNTAGEYRMKINVKKT